MGELTFTPWRRYGHDRVYIADGETKLGHLDRVTGAISLADARRAAEITDALVARGFLGAAADAPAVALPPDPEPWALTLPGDTATYKPGATARAQAAVERAAAPAWRAVIDRLRGMHTPERAWRVGAEGEEDIARRLRTLPDCWLVLHDLPVGERKANIDHLAIGPGGVFTMNTKNLSHPVVVKGDTFRAHGFATGYVHVARHESARVQRLLSERVGTAIGVQGVIVVIAPELTITEPPRDVAVVPQRTIRNWLASRPAVLAPAQVARLERVARDPRTWR